MRTARLTIVLQSARHSPCGSRIRGFRLSLATALRFFTSHETRITAFMLFTNHESRNTAFFSVGAQGWRHRQPQSGPLRPPASHCFPVHHCSLLFAIVHHCSPKNIVRGQCSRAARSLLRWARSLGMARLRAAIARHGRHIAPAPASLPRPPFSLSLTTGRSLGIPEKCTKSRFPQENAPSAALAAVPVALRAASEAANAK